LTERGKDSKEVIAKRLDKTREEISHYAEYDYLVINDNLEVATKELISIIIANRLTTVKQTNKNIALLQALCDGN
jgi:guanylate kinase